MRRTMFLMTSLLLMLGLPGVSGATSSDFVFVDELPSADIRWCEQPGVVQHITYPAHDVLGDGEPITKPALVYLPYGYSAGQRYDVLVLMHGIGGTETEWGFAKDFSVIKNAIDNLIARGEIRPLIIVMPNGRACADYKRTTMDNADAFYCFGQELREDLLPYIDAHYATYGADTLDDLTASREHRAMAGLSMGGMQTINIGLCECLDLFAWFGAFSAAPTAYTAEQIAARLETSPEEIRYFYSICGTEDSLYFAGSQAAKTLTAATDRLNEGNWHWQERSGGHDFNIWNLGLYNFVRIWSARAAESEHAL